MMIERMGKWSWSLSAEERLAAAAASRAQRDRTDITPAKLRRVHEAMLVKQKKLSARVLPGRASAGLGAWPHRT
ncbi:MAG: hypothetical protein HYR63_10170 [Proteobacteria bacterium]|nr:hypothetical protein [Pseudomonadota bacterium]MBI3499767.1 hypothetical protein [Pseudomonadota bacterium]